MTTTTLKPALTPIEIKACWPLLKLLRPHLADIEAFTARVERQRQQGYRLHAVWQDAIPLAIAGWRIQENLIYGHHLYVDDLVTDPAHRGKRLASRLLKALMEEGRAANCTLLVLDTGKANTTAQAFYLREGLENTAIRFSTPL